MGICSKSVVYRPKELQITWNVWWCGSRGQHEAGQVGAYSSQVPAVGQPAIERPGDDLVLHGGTQQLQRVTVQESV